MNSSSVFEFARTSEEFARTIERNTAEFGRAWAESTKLLRTDIGIESQRIAGGVAVFAGVGSPITQALGIGLDGPVATDELDRLEKFFFDRGASCDIETTPFIDDSVLQWLRERPYRLAEFSQVHSLDLACVDSPVNPNKSDIAISIATPAEYKEFTRTVALGYTHGEPVAENDLLIFEGSSHVDCALSFLARVDGKPAGGATLSVYDGIAGFHGGSTLPEFRGRGVQTALILARFYEARSRGCKCAFSVTLPTGSSQRNMTRFGFAPAYTRVKFTRAVAG